MSYHFNCCIILIVMEKVLAHKTCIVVIPFDIERIPLVFIWAVLDFITKHIHNMHNTEMVLVYFYFYYMR